MIVPVTFFAFTILLAESLAPAGYRRAHHTVSDLAAQDAPRKWIMQMGFIGYGLLLPAALLVRGLVWPEIPLVLEGVAILLSGILCAAPLDPAAPRDARAAAWHAHLATIAGVLFSVSIFLHLITDPRPEEKRLHALFLAPVVALSIAFLYADRGRLAAPKGLIQRALYVVSFAWLLFGTGRLTSAVL